MRSDILFVSKKQNRGGAIYEEQVKRVLEGEYNLDILELNPAKNKLFYFDKLKYFYQIKTYKPHKKYQVLIANKAGVYAGILKRDFQKKILILHHFFNEENSYPVINRLLKDRLLSNLNQFDLIVVVSDYWKEHFSKYVSVNKIYTIHNSFDIDKINLIKNNFNKESFKAKYNIPEDKIIVYAGNALKIKGYLDVIHQLDKNNYFVITSGNTDKNAVHNHLHLNLNYNEYIQLLCSADITIILSRFQEGWSRIAHESLICGTPVIGSNVAGMGELLQNAKQIIWSENDNLSELLNRSLKQKEFINYGKNYASQFNLEYFKNKWKIISSV